MDRILTDIQNCFTWNRRIPAYTNGFTRWGLDAELVDVDAECSVPARELVEKFLEFVRPAIEEFGEWDEVYAIALETMQQGNGAARQREAYKHTESLEDVVDFIVRETAKGTTSV